MNYLYPKTNDFQAKCQGCQLGIKQEIRGRRSTCVSAVWRTVIAQLCFLIENFDESTMPRPFFRKTTDELEQLFRECGNTPEQLRMLVEELRHQERPKAVALCKKVEVALSQVGLNDPQMAFAQDDSGLNKQPEPETTDDQLGKPQRSTQTTTGSFQDFAPPEQFTLVQPMGVHPRPSAFRPTLQNDLRLPISPGDSPTKIYRLALAELKIAFGRLNRVVLKCFHRSLMNSSGVPNLGSM